MPNLSPMTEFWINKPAILYNREYSKIIYLFDEKYLFDKTKINLFLIPVIVAGMTYIIRRRIKDKPNKQEIHNRMLNGELHGPMLKVMGKECRLPTDENPFMNPMITDYGTTNTKKKICDYYNNKAIHKMVDDKFLDGLYQDVNDIFGKNNSQREFYTVPVTSLPNDQENFAKWLYSTPVSCSIGNNGLLKQRRSCSFNSKTLEEINKEVNPSKCVPKSKEV